MGDVTELLASLVDDPDPIRQAGVGLHATSSPSSFTAINTSTIDNTAIKRNTSEPRRSNKKPKTAFEFNKEHNGPDTALNPELLHQIDDMTTTSSSGTRSATVIPSFTSNVAPKRKPKTSRNSKGKAAKEDLSLSRKFLESTAFETGSAAAAEEKTTIEIHKSAKEAEWQLFQHGLGWHEGRDPYGLASQPYLWREELVPWWVCRMCKEEDEGTREGGAWLSQG